MQYNVSTAKVIVATFFAFCCAGKVCIDSFLTVFLRHVGLTPFQAGVFRGLQALAGGASVVSISYCTGVFHKRLGWAVFILIAILCNVLLLISSLHYPCFYAPHPSCSSRNTVAKPTHATSSHLLTDNDSISNDSVVRNEQNKFLITPSANNVGGTEKYQVIKKHDPASSKKISHKHLNSTPSTKVVQETAAHLYGTNLEGKLNFSTSNAMVITRPKAKDTKTLSQEIRRTTRSTSRNFSTINTRTTVAVAHNTEQSDMETNTFFTKVMIYATRRISNTDALTELPSEMLTHSVIEGRESKVLKNGDTNTHARVQTPKSSVGVVGHNVEKSSHYIEDVLPKSFQGSSYNRDIEMKRLGFRRILPNSDAPVQRENFPYRVRDIYQQGYRYPRNWRALNNQWYNGSRTHPWYWDRRNVVLRKRSYTVTQESSLNNSTSILQAQILTTESLLWPSFSVSCILVILALILLGEVSSSPIDKVADESWYQYLDEIDYIERYDQRTSGVSVTTTSTLLLIVLIVKFYCTSELLVLPAYHLHFYTFALFWAAMFFLSYFYPRPMGSSGQSHNLFKGLAFIRYMGHDGASSLVLITVFVCGALHGCINDYLLWYMEDLGADEFITTSAVAIAMASEILPQIFSKYFFRRTSLSCMLSISVFTYSIRFALLALMWTPWAIAITQILHCLSNYFFWNGIQGYVTRLCFQGTGRSVLFIMHLIHHQLGRALGSCFGGLVFSLSKPRTLFFAMSGIALLWGLLFTLFQYCLSGSRKGRLSESISQEYGDGDELQFSRLLGDEDEEDDWLELAMKDNNKHKKRKQAR